MAKAEDENVWQKLKRLLSKEGNREELGKLGDFTTPPHVILLSLIALGIGVVSAFVALALLRLIGLFTNLFFFQRWSTTLVSPAGNKLGLLEILVPVIGALIVGFMARYGSERIRGHGIPEALESILLRGSRIEPKVTWLKPLSAAISIGSGGPFGAEGPIIVTGGSLGSMIAQSLRLTSAERKTLLVAGAAAGMSATFNSPVAAVLLAVVVKLFEWKPRSIIPVAVASAAAAVVRQYLLGTGPLFPTPPHPVFIGVAGIVSCILVGILAGIAALLLTMAVYAAEDGFRRLPIHWMWWPAIGGVVVGIGGLIYPRALGVGYDTIALMLKGDMALQLVLGMLIVKSIIWTISLGSGTSGGILAPLLLIGGALGGVEALFLPHEGLGFWALISMAAVLGGAMRAPLTAIIFSLELTHDMNALLPLLIAVGCAYGFTVLALRRSILTEKISRRGYHLTQEYATDPLEILFVREVMRTNIVALPADATLQDVAQSLRSDHRPHGQRLYPVIDAEKQVLGVVTRNDLQKFLQTNNEQRPLLELIQQQPIVAYPDEPLRAVAYRMAETNLTSFPVVERGDAQKLVGIISLRDLLKGHARNLEEERHRERVLRLRLLFPQRTRKQEVLLPPERAS
ncbi:MAG: chloride channel protein [Ktedonobacteraceae bacterium]|nr:chloride channel protein [Ktedonobacteraceae bacterium]